MKHNIYAEGNFQNIEFSDNNVDRSVGVVETGSYSFTPERDETIQCVTGALTINNEKCLPGQEATVKKGEPFSIAAEETSSYLCIYR